MGTHKIEFVQRVPHSVESIFSIGSYDNPALLLYALEQYEKGDVCAQAGMATILGKNGGIVFAYIYIYISTHTHIYKYTCTCIELYRYRNTNAEDVHLVFLYIPNMFFGHAYKLESVFCMYIATFVSTLSTQ